MPTNTPNEVIAEIKEYWQAHPGLTLFVAKEIVMGEGPRVEDVDFQLLETLWAKPGIETKLLVDLLRIQQRRIEALVEFYTASEFSLFKKDNVINRLEGLKVIK